MTRRKINLWSKKLLIPLALLVVAIPIGILLLYLWGGWGKADEKSALVPKAREIVQQTGGVPGTEVGTGWSTKENPAEAVTEAVQMALEGKKYRVPDLAIIFATSGSDLRSILSKTQELLGEKTMVFGGTSDSRAVMTNKGFVRATQRAYEQALMEGKRGLALMTIKSKDIVFGVGSASFSDYRSPREASRAAALAALKKAGKSPEEKPRAALVTITIGSEEEAIGGIEEVLGKSTPILGGTAGGPALGVFGEKGIYDEGISLAVIYTDLPVGWTFEGGFDPVEARSGVVTKVNGQAIVEIDHRPALDVYNEWLDGKIDRLYKEIGKPDVIRDLLTLNPLYRKYVSSNRQTFFLFSHPWPKDSTLRDRSIMTSTRIKAGERIYLSRGTWETLLNRIGKLPRMAKTDRGLDPQVEPVLGIAFVCGGVLGAIPDTERDKMPVLINHATNGVPFIANFTWGEQGHFPGIGSKHGNLLTSFIFIAGKK